MRAQMLGHSPAVPDAVVRALFVWWEVGGSPFASSPVLSLTLWSASQQAGEPGDKAPSSV